MPFHDHILYQWHEFGKITFNTRIKKSLGKINYYLMSNNRSNPSILNNGIEKNPLETNFEFRRVDKTFKNMIV